MDYTIWFNESRSHVFHNWVCRVSASLYHVLPCFNWWKKCCDLESNFRTWVNKKELQWFTVISLDQHIVTPQKDAEHVPLTNIITMILLFGLWLLPPLCVCLKIQYPRVPVDYILFRWQFLWVCSCTHRWGKAVVPLKFVSLTATNWRTDILFR